MSDTQSLWALNLKTTAGFTYSTKKTYNTKRTYITNKNSFVYQGPNFHKNSCLTASNRNGNTLKRFKDVCFNANARIWPWLSYMCHIRSTGDGETPPQKREREFFIDNLLVRVHFIIVMIRWTGLAPWEFEFPFPGSLTFTPPKQHAKRIDRYIASGKSYVEQVAAYVCSS